MLTYSLVRSLAGSAGLSGGLTGRVDQEEAARRIAICGERISLFIRMRRERSHGELTRPRDQQQVGVMAVMAVMVDMIHTIRYGGTVVCSVVVPGTRAWGELDGCWHYYYTTIGRSRGGAAGHGSFITIIVETRSYNCNRYIPR